MKKEVNLKRINVDHFANQQHGRMVINHDLSCIMHESHPSFFSQFIQRCKTLPTRLQNLIHGKDMKTLVSSLVLIYIWVILDFLQGLGVNNIIVRILSTLTFADGGGLNRGGLGIVGGIVGRGIYASVLFSFLDGDGKKIIKGAKEIFSLAPLQDKNNYGVLLITMGLGLICFQALAGSATLSDLMIVITPILLISQSSQSKNSLLMILSERLFKNKMNVGLKGFAIGFALGLIFVIIPFFGNLCMYVGLVILLFGLVFNIINKKGGVNES